MDELTTVQRGTLTALATDIVSAYVSNNPVPAADLPALITSTHAALVTLRRNGAPEPAIEKPTPAQIRKSITPDALTSFLDGRPYKTLKRHLNSHGLTFEAYRERYDLPRDYPSTAPSYSAERSALARSLGLGQKRQTAAVDAASVVASKGRETTVKSARRKSRKAPEAAAAE